jgi:hypothetical protein
MDTLFGLPAHPFLVHIPIVLLPLAALGVVVMVVKPTWHERYRWVVLGVTAVGALGAVLAASAGEELEGRIIAVEGAAAAGSWEHHAELGDTARLFAVIFLVLLAAYVIVPWWTARRSRQLPAELDQPPRRTKTLGVVLAALALVGAAASVVTVIRAGHTGSQSVWEDYVSKTSGP